MSEDLCIDIPAELKSFQKFVSTKQEIQPQICCNFVVKLSRKANGEIESAIYYSDTGSVSKKIYYTGSAISHIEYYENEYVKKKEDYTADLLSKCTYYDKQNEVNATVIYEYNRIGKITKIKKIVGVKTYEITYGYDELDRVCARLISVNKNVVKLQKYKYDILDRVVEYQDEIQLIRVKRISSKNELISYSISDKNGNDIEVNNEFNYNEYVKTEIQLNGHKVFKSDITYVDNVMLKKPYTTEDDLDFIISNLFKPSDELKTKRTNCRDISSDIISTNIKEQVLPISLRKRLLYNIAVNA